MTQELKPIKGRGWLCFIGLVMISIGVYLIFFPAVGEEQRGWATPKHKSPEFIPVVPKPRLIEPGTYVPNKKIGQLGSGIEVVLEKVDILEDRSPRLYLVFQHNLNSDAWIFFKEPNRVMLTDNLANKYKLDDQSVADTKLFLGPFAVEKIILDFPPLKRNITSVTFRGLLAASRSDGTELLSKVEYRLQ